jgi:hypothetical protein
MMMLTGFPGQHQVEHDQVVKFPLQRAVHAGCVGHGLHRKALIGEIALEQLAQPQVVIDDQNLDLGFVHGLNPSGIDGFLPAGFTNDYKGGQTATLGLQPLSRMQAYRKSGIDKPEIWHRRQS